MSSTNKFPCFKGRAEEMSGLGQPPLKAWEEYMDPASWQHRLVRLALQACVSMEEILKTNEHNFRLFEPDATKFKNFCFQYNACISALGSFCHAKAVWLFHFTIKNHHLGYIFGLLAVQMILESQGPGVGASFLSWHLPSEAGEQDDAAILLCGLVFVHHTRQIVEVMLVLWMKCLLEPSWAYLHE